MSRPIARHVGCALCGHVNITTDYMSSLTLGPSDLDLRPALMARQTTMGWVEDCEACGYCSPDLRYLSKGAAETVSGFAYQMMFTGDSLPGSRFRRLAMLAEADQDRPLAGLAWRSAAWAADDRGEPDLARRWRLAAAERLSRSRNVEWAGCDRIAAHLALADLWRRAGAWDKARRAAARGKRLKGGNETLTRALAFEIELAGRRDDQTYRFGDWDETARRKTRPELRGLPVDL